MPCRTSEQVQKLITEDISSKQVDCLGKIGLWDWVVFPDTDEHAARIDSCFNNCAKLKSACILMPQVTAEVATAIKALVNAGQTFAIRSGGSNFWPSNNIDGGATIDLGRMNASEYDPKSETIIIGVWGFAGQIYERLAKYERAVGAAREASVGIAGLALTGGIALFIGRYGFACDQVVSHEVVLADGRIVIADATGEHAELFKALKGGGNNFGIVPHFTIRALPCSTVWGGGAMLPKEIFPEAVEAIVDFVKRVPVTIVAALYANVAGVEKPPILDKWLAFPETWK